MTKTRQDNDMIDGIGAVYAENETELSKSIEPVQSMTKIRKDNDMIDCIGTVYAKSDTELSWSIRPCANYDKNQIGQWRDWYRCGLYQKWNWDVVID